MVSPPRQPDFCFLLFIRKHNKGEGNWHVIALNHAFRARSVTASEGNCNRLLCLFSDPDVRDSTRSSTLPLRFTLSILSRMAILSSFLRNRLRSSPFLAMMFSLGLFWISALSFYFVKREKILINATNWAPNRWYSWPGSYWTSIRKELKHVR